MQTIVANLIFQDGALPAPVSALSPWLDMTLPPLEQICQALEAQTHRRFIKSHLALDGLPYFDTARYIVVCRDARDVFMSIWNHHTGYSEELKPVFRERAAMLGADFALDVTDIHEMFRMWVSSSPFAWEKSGFPYWSHMHHAQTWWDYRHLPNILMVHFADLLVNPEQQVRRIAQFLDIAIDEKLLPGVLDRISFNNMKENFNNIMAGADKLWRGGGQTFMNKGTNGRWRGVLTEAELEQCRAVIAQELTPDCADWVENGGEHRLALSVAKNV